ncbi:MAG: LLM class flavin-dependent oxidoreductase [Candidatus Lambdaproteobacteria bacterium]|nr:LLM class flavin-dependent oxidoreductase [Candidatus Lambdaproteobacteria bacterium]
MDFGITWAKIDEMEYITLAEQMGYTHLWVTDSQMIRSNCFAVLTMAAMKTKTMKLGTGVAVPGLRLAPVVANGIATINRIAPGRCFVALGTGNTGMRLLGRRPMRLKEFREYVKVVRGLIRGEEVEYAHDGQSHKIRFLLLDKGYVNVEDRIPLYVAAYGPKAQALAGELADGLTTAIPRGGSLDDILANVRRGAQRAGRTLEGFHLSCRVNLAILAPGEAVNSERIIRECGPAFMTAVHGQIERLKETGEEPPAYLRPIWQEYVAFHLSRPEAVRHQLLHESHNAFVDPQEARFITPEMIKAFCVVGRPEEVVEQLRELQRRGVAQLMCNFPLVHGYEMIKDYAKNIIQKM